MKVLHLHTNVAGNSWGLAQGEKRIGMDSTVLCSSSSYIDYPSDIKLHLEKHGRPAMLWELFKTFLEIKDKYDIFHFDFGTTLLCSSTLGLNLLDLPFYGKDKRLFVTYNGCDARQKYPTMRRYGFSACHVPECYNGVCLNTRVEKFKKKRIEKMSRYVDHMFSVNPDLLHFLPKEKSSFLPYTISSWYEIGKIPHILGKKPLMFVHAPTDRAAKGSDYIISAFQNLQKKYPEKFQYKLVEKLSHTEAMKIYREADVIVDQVLVGWYGGFAVEAMKMGKPVAVFIRHEDLSFISAEMSEQLLSSIIQITPDTIYEALEQYVLHPHMITDIAERGYQYVTRWHDPVKIAKYVAEFYAGKAPKAYE